MNPQFNLFEKLGEYFRPPVDFFNTIELSGKELKDAKAQTGLQDRRVLEIYRKGSKMTPVEAWEAYCRSFPVCPLTSIRRSITVLTGRGLLKKTGDMKPGRYGKKNYCWEVG